MLDWVASVEVAAATELPAKLCWLWRARG